MPEKKRAPHQSGRGKGNVSQIQGHLCDKTADELLTELEARMDEMTDPVSYTHLTLPTICSV